MSNDNIYMNPLLFQSLPINLNYRKICFCSMSNNYMCICVLSRPETALLMASDIECVGAPARRPRQLEAKLFRMLIL